MKLPSIQPATPAVFEHNASPMWKSCFQSWMHEGEAREALSTRFKVYLVYTTAFCFAQCITKTSFHLSFSRPFPQLVHSEALLSVSLLPLPHLPPFWSFFSCFCSFHPQDPQRGYPNPGLSMRMPWTFSLTDRSRDWIQVRKQGLDEISRDGKKEAMIKARTKAKRMAAKEKTKTRART